MRDTQKPISFTDEEQQQKKQLRKRQISKNDEGKEHNVN